jgi:ribonuclease HI
MEKRLFVYSDGGARGNPGPAAIGVVVVDEEGKIIAGYKESIGIKTNNQAEYLAMIKAFEIAGKYSRKAHFQSDSELIIKQLLGEYKIRNKELLELFKIVEEKEKKFEEVSYQHVPRENEFIQEADRLVNKALDEERRELKTLKKEDQMQVKI